MVCLEEVAVFNYLHCEFTSVLRLIQEIANCQNPVAANLNAKKNSPPPAVTFAATHTVHVQITK